MPTALLNVMKEGRQEIAFFDFAPRHEPTEAERVVAALRDYDKRRYELLDVSRQEAVGTVNHLLCEAKPDDPLLATYIRACGDLGMDRSVPCIAKYRGHPDPKVELAVIRTFGQVMALDYADWLAGFATHPEPELRKQAAIALGKIPHESIPPKLDAFAAADPDLAPVAQFGKVKIALFIDDPSEAKVVELVHLELASDEYEDLVQRVPYVAKALDDIVKNAGEPELLRTRAVRVLGLGRLPAVALTYFWVLGQKPLLAEEMRFEAILAMGRLHMRSADDVLLEQVFTAEPRLRQAAVWALGQIRKPSVVERLLQAWDLEDGALRPGIAATARKLATLDGAPMLTSALDADHAAPSDAVFFIDDKALTRGLRLGEVEAQLQSPVPEARRDAALLFAFFGPSDRAKLLFELSERETDPGIKDIALRGWARLERLERLALLAQTIPEG